jgi:hypothetical protein
MFHSEAVGRAIHADRVRDLERAAREHRLLIANDETPFRQTSPIAVRATQATKRPACGDVAGQPA